MGRPPCCDKTNVKRGPWTAEEDAKILAYVATHGTGNWTLVPKKAGLNRCGKSCRLRWTNYLRPDLNHSSFTSQEEDLILKFHKAIGSRWSLIAKQLPGRTDNDVKNYWNTKLRKKLTDLRIDPVTHKPFSQVISEFGVIGGGGAAPPNPASTVPVGPPMVPESAYYSSRAAAINPNFPLSAFRDGVVTPPVGTDFRFGSSDPLRDEKFQSDHANGNENGGFGALGYEAGSSSCSRSLMVGSSFVEEVLDRDSEMQREFPCAFMDESFYC